MFHITLDERIRKNDTVIRVRLRAKNKKSFSITFIDEKHARKWLKENQRTFNDYEVLFDWKEVLRLFMVGKGLTIHEGIVRPKTRSN